MSEDIIKIKCDKCGGTNVTSEEIPDPPYIPKETTVSMDQYIEGENQPKYSVIHTKQWQLMKLKCLDCGFEKGWYKNLQMYSYTYG